MEFSIRSMKQLLKQNTEKRVSEEAAGELGDFLDDWATGVGEESVEVAAEDDRQTVRAEDIREVLRRRQDREVEHQMEL
ncbi:MAG: histone [Candidatus Nanohaloarchaea archaeon]